MPPIHITVAGDRCHVAYRETIHTAVAWQVAHAAYKIQLEGVPMTSCVGTYIIDDEMADWKKSLKLCDCNADGEDN